MEMVNGKRVDAYYCNTCNGLNARYARKCSNCGARRKGNENLDFVPEYMVARSKVSRATIVAVVLFCAVAAGLLCGWLVYRKPSVDSTLFVKEKSSQLIKNNEYDGSVLPAKQWLAENLVDYSSYESVVWGKVVYVPNNPEVTYIVWNKYRAKNAVGAYELQTRVWWYNSKAELLETFLKDGVH